MADIEPQPTTEAGRQRITVSALADAMQRAISMTGRRTDFAEKAEWMGFARAVLAILHYQPAIEMEARASQPLTLDAERLQQAYLTVDKLWRTDGFTPANSFWPRVAAEYERLSRP